MVSVPLIDGYLGTQAGMSLYRYKATSELPKGKLMSHRSHIGVFYVPSLSRFVDWTIAGGVAIKDKGKITTSWVEAGLQLRWTGRFFVAPNLTYEAGRGIVSIDIGVVPARKSN
jgi:hypothetical protein